MKKGKILIYKKEEAVGLIKFDKNKLCRVYKENFDKSVEDILYAGKEVVFELEKCAKLSDEEEDIYVAKNVKLIE